MVEALMLVLLGMLVMTLISLALAPVLWARAARVTTEKIQQDVHSAAFDEASQTVSRKYEGELAERESALRSEIEQRESALRSEIEQLEASRDKISAEASGRVNALEETRTVLEETRASLEQQVAGLEQQVAGLETEIGRRDDLLEEANSRYQALADRIAGLGSRADSLGREAADLGSRAGALSSEIADLGQTHHEIAQSLHPETAVAAPAPVAAAATEPAPADTTATPEPISVTVEQPDEDTVAAADDAPDTNGAASMKPDEDADEAPHEPIPAQEPSLSDRIRALRDGASA